MIGTSKKTPCNNPSLLYWPLPWFNRLWIVQEVVFNLDIMLMCGDSVLSWARLLMALSIRTKIPGVKVSWGLAAVQY
jgi:hypothetical protein